MKKIKTIIAVAIFFLGIFSLSSCYTKKQGIVPCPGHGFNDVEIESVDVVPVRKV